MSKEPTTVFGASDDLIEFRGGVYEEFSFCPRDEDETRMLAFSDGSLLRVQYDDHGIWRFNVLAKGGLFDAHHPYMGEDNPHAENRESDAVTFQPGIRWALLGDQFTYGKKS